MINLVKLLWILPIFLSFAAYSQQDPQFSQNMFNHLTINPGFAGNSGLINASILNRNQWTGFPGAPVTTLFNVEAPIKIFGKSSGAGITFVKDVIGYENNISASLSYSYRFRAGQGQLGCGLSAGMLNVNLKPDWINSDGGDLVNGSDPALPSQEVSGVMADFGAGLFYQHKDYYLAMSAKHLHEPKFSYQEEGQFTISRNYYITGGYSVRLSNEKMMLLPSFFLKSDISTTQIDICLMIEYNKRFWGGISYRNSDAIIVLLGYEMQNGLKIGYSYDISTSVLSRYNAGSHELFVSYSVLLNKNKGQKTKSVRFL